MNEREAIDKIVQAATDAGLATFAGETQFAGWSDAHNTGAKIVLWLPDSDALEPFRGMTARKGGVAGQRLIVLAFEIGADEQPVSGSSSGRPPDFDSGNAGSRPAPEAKPFGQYAKELYRLGFFNVLEVLAAIGTDAQYAEWIQTQPCAACGGGDLVEQTGELLCEAAHWNTAANAGKSIKAAYSYMPICHEHHIHVQHHQGISALHAVYLARTGGHTTENHVQAAKDWAEKRVAHYRALWGGKTLAYILGCGTSMGYVAPETLREWAVGMGLEKYIPSAYNGDLLPVVATQLNS